MMTWNHLPLSEINLHDTDVYDISLKLNKAMGADGVGPKILLHCAIALYKSLSPFSLILSEQVLPMERRTYSTILIF